MVFRSSCSSPASAPLSAAHSGWRGKTMLGAMRPQPLRQHLLYPRLGWCQRQGCSRLASRAPLRRIQEMAEPLPHPLNWRGFPRLSVRPGLAPALRSPCTARDSSPSNIARGEQTADLRDFHDPPHRHRLHRQLIGAVFGRRTELVPTARPNCVLRGLKSRTWIPALFVLY